MLSKRVLVSRLGRWCGQVPGMARSPSALSDARPSAAVSELPTLLDISDVASHLGVSARHVRRLVTERRIPYIKWGHLLRFDPRELEAWLDQSRVEPRRF